MRPAAEPQRAAAPAPTAAPAAPNSARSGPAKLSFKERREFETLPDRIEHTEAAIRTLETRLASPEFYRESAPVISEAVEQLSRLQAELKGAYERWHELDERRGK
jgi:ATP-binding cassette subfamily F protein uup